MFGVYKFFVYSVCHVRSLGIACFSLVVGVSRCYSVENWRCVWNSVDIIIVIKLALARIFLSNCQEYFLLSGVFSNWRFRSSFTSNHNCLVKLFDRHFCSIKMRVNDSKQFYSLRESIIHCFFSPEYSYTIQKQWCLYWSKRQYGIFRAIKYSYGTANSCFFINSFCISIPFWPEKY